MNEIDHITLARAQKKDDAAFKKLYDYYAPFVWKIAFRTLHGNRQQAQEAVQDTFIRVNQSLAKFNKDAALSTWLYRIVYNACMTILAKQKVATETLPLDEAMIGVSHGSTQFEAKDQVDVILSKLNAEDRFLLSSRELLDISYEDLAEITGRNEGTLRTQLCRIKESIRSMYKSL